jgi:hypothetical protein
VLQEEQARLLAGTSKEGGVVDADADGKNLERLDEVTAQLEAIGTRVSPSLATNPP